MGDLTRFLPIVPSDRGGVLVPLPTCTRASRAVPPCAPQAGIDPPRKSKHLVPSIGRTLANLFPAIEFLEGLSRSTALSRQPRAVPRTIRSICGTARNFSVKATFLKVGPCFPNRERTGGACISRALLHLGLTRSVWKGDTLAAPKVHPMIGHRDDMAPLQLRGAARG
jgi:hypothetical protein